MDDLEEIKRLETNARVRKRHYSSHGFVERQRLATKELSDATSDESEQWIPVVGFEDLYAVSDSGRVARYTDGWGFPCWRILKPSISPGNYLQVGLGRRSSSITRQVHSIVAESFFGPRPVGTVINHKNGNRADNRRENLEYITQRENVLHARHVLRRIQAVRTVCKRGHAFTHENTRYGMRDGRCTARRDCRICLRMRQRRGSLGINARKGVRIEFVKLAANVQAIIRALKSS